MKADYRLASWTRTCTRHAGRGSRRGRGANQSARGVFGDHGGRQVDELEIRECGCALGALAMGANAAFAIGAIAGAHLGKVVVYSILTLGVVALFLDKRGNSDTHEHVQGKDAAPAFRPKRKPKMATQPTGKTAAQRWIEGE